jgi:hypothetical protein
MKTELDGMAALSEAVSKGEWPHTTDAVKWAKEFNKVLVSKGEQPWDPGFLIGWFANAIMAGHDNAWMKATNEYRSQLEKFRAAELLTPKEK